jgi:predicted acyl esterase
LHGLEHWTHFYTDYGRSLQLEFFDHFLKGEDNGWDRRPPVLLQVRHLDRFEPRTEDAWPIPRTTWTNLYLRPDLTLGPEPPDEVTTLDFEAMGDGLTFRTDPLETETEITGPSSATLWVSSTTDDADLFLVLRVFDPEGHEVTFQGALDPHTPIAHGWLRVSHRELDPEISEPYRPYHTHRSAQLLEPGEAVEANVEIWPTSIVAPAGYTLALTILGRDYRNDLAADDAHSEISSFKNTFTGCGPFIHDDPVDRPAGRFSGTTTLHLGPDRRATLLIPVIPPK